MKYSFWIKQEATLAGGPFGPVIQEWEASWASLAIDQETAAFNTTIQREMDSISGIVGKGRRVEDRHDYQYRVRPLYHQFGYTDPASFLKKVVEYKLLGEFKISIHEDLTKVLDKAGPILDRWSPGLAASTAKEMSGVLGIQIRTIKGKKTLSNHAFGLAFDIDPYSNPHVVAQPVIEALNWAVGHRFDFGKVILTRDEREHKAWTKDDIMELHNRGRQASDEVRSWLQAHLPRYRTLITRVETAEKTLALKRVESWIKLEDRSRFAEKAFDRIAKRRGTKSLMSEPLPADSPESVAIQEIRVALSKIAADENLRRVQVLHENIKDTKYIDTWKERGVLTVPMYLAVVLVGELGLRWGEQYKKGKDAMHFELLGKGDRPYIPPDAPLASREKPRTLERHMQEAFAMKGRLRFSMWSF